MARKHPSQCRMPVADASSRLSHHISRSEQQIPLNTFELTGLLFLGSLLAGFLGSLTGLGGGVVIVPLLTLAFGVDIRYAIGASLVSVIATSSGAAAAYVREGFSNIRIGMFLEIATTVGAITGAVVAAYLKLSWIAIVFGLVLLYSAYRSVRSRTDLRGPSATGSNRLPSSHGRLLPRFARHPLLSRHQRPRRLQPDVHRRSPLRRAGHWLRRSQSSRHGPRHDASPSKSPPPPATS